MPTLFRFLVVLLVLAGLAGGAMFYLANFVKPNQRELTVRIPPDKLEPTEVATPTPPPATAPAAAAEPETPEPASVQPPSQPE